VLAALLRVLDGRRSTEEVIGLLLVEGFSPGDVLGALQALDDAELLEEAVPPELAPLRPEEVGRLAEQAEVLAAFEAPEQLTEGSWPPRGLAAQAALRNSNVGIAGDGAFACALVEALALAGVGALTLEDGLDARERPVRELVRQLSAFCSVANVASNTWPDVILDRVIGILVYCPEHFTREAALFLNSACVDRGLPFLPTRRGLYEVVDGPLVVPRETACYRCFEIRATAMGVDWSDEPLRRAEPRLAFPVGADLLALEVVKFLSGVAEPVLRGHLRRLDLLSGLHDLHPVLKVPRCPVCGPDGKRPARKVWDE
jgi:bacteriocin biosynthesis cyclodehydratase domain-containing protein